MRRSAFCAAVGIVLASVAAMMACEQSPTAPLPLELTTVGGEVPVIDVPRQRLYVQWRTAAVFEVSVSATTRYDGAAASLAGIAALYDAGYMLHVDVSGHGGAIIEAAAVTTTKSGPFPKRIQQVLGTYRIWFGVPALQYQKMILMLPSDAIVDPSSEIPSLEALFEITEPGAHVCVMADTYTVATVSYRATRLRARVSTEQIGSTCSDDGVTSLDGAIAKSISSVVTARVAVVDPPPEPAVASPSR